MACDEHLLTAKVIIDWTRTTLLKNHRLPFLSLRQRRYLVLYHAWRRDAIAASSSITNSAFTRGVRCLAQDGTRRPNAKLETGRRYDHEQQLTWIHLQYASLVPLSLDAGPGPHLLIDAARLRPQRRSPRSGPSPKIRILFSHSLEHMFRAPMAVKKLTGCVHLLQMGTNLG